MSCLFHQDLFFILDLCTQRFFDLVIVSKHTVDGLTGSKCSLKLACDCFEPVDIVIKYRADKLRIFVTLCTLFASENACMGLIVLVCSILQLFQLIYDLLGIILSGFEFSKLGGQPCQL